MADQEEWLSPSPDAGDSLTGVRHSAFVGSDGGVCIMKAGGTLHLCAALCQRLNRTAAKSRPVQNGSDLI